MTAGPTLLQQGIDLMIYGMGTVIVFLTLMVFLTRIMSTLVSRFTPAPVISAGAKPSTPDAQTVAVITAAVTRYRNQHAANKTGE